MNVGKGLKPLVQTNFTGSTHELKLSVATI